MRSFRWIGAALLLVLFSVTPASAGQHDYLALGDSVAFGYRPPAVTPPGDYFDAANFVGYPELYSPNVTNASCPGETTDSMITLGAQSNGCRNSVGSPVGYRTLFPLHVNYSGTQLEYAVQFLKSHPRTRQVTIDIGANDLFVCQETTPDRCTGDSFPAALGRIGGNLTTIFSALREEAWYRHDLVLVSYYSLDYRDPATTAQVQALNAALTGPTLEFGGVVADGFGAFQEASRSAGGDPCAAGLLIALPGGGCDIHPSEQGHTLLAGAVEEAVAKGDRKAA